MEILESLLKYKWSFSISRVRGMLEFGYVANAWKDREEHEALSKYDGIITKPRIYCTAYGDTVITASNNLLNIIKEKYPKSC